MSPQRKSLQDEVEDKRRKNKATKTKETTTTNNTDREKDTLDINKTEDIEVSRNYITIVKSSNKTENGTEDKENTEKITQTKTRNLLR